MGLVMKHGKKVLEVWPRVNWNKGMAVRWLLSLLGLNSPGVVPIYIGDDLSDEYAFRAIGGSALAAPSHNSKHLGAGMCGDSDEDAAQGKPCTEEDEESGGACGCALGSETPSTRKFGARSFSDPEGDVVCAGDGIGIIVAPRLGSVPWQTRAQFSLCNPREVQRFLQRLVEARDEGDAVAAGVSQPSAKEGLDAVEGLSDGRDLEGWHWCWTKELHEDECAAAAAVTEDETSSSSVAKLSESAEHHRDEWTLLVKA